MNIVKDALAFLKTKITLANSLNLTDINIYAENFYRDLYNVMGFSYKNVNFDKQNASSIDLIDDDNEIAIQITSQNDNTKIFDTVKGFFEKEDQKYQNYKLELLLIAKDAKDCTTDFTLGGKYNFNHKTDVIDMNRLQAQIDDKLVSEIERIANFLKKEVYIIPSSIDCDEVETIMTLIQFLCKDNNRVISPIEGEVDPDKKINTRFAAHASYLVGQYITLQVLFSSALEQARNNMDSFKSILISQYLQDMSYQALIKCNNDPAMAINNLVNDFSDKLSSIGTRQFNRGAIKFYLLDEMIKCNVFPMINAAF